MEETAIIQEIRKQNIADNEKILEQIRAELKQFMPEIYKQKPQNERGSKKRKRTSSPVERRFNPSRLARYSPPRTRGRSGSVTSSTVSSPDKMVVRFGFFGRHDNVSESEILVDSDEECELEVRKKKSVATVRDIRSADEITDEDLQMVADTVKDKRYDSIYGSTCHQCRQKTNDMKTICRSETCYGVRGQFCGPCLRNRYGENAREVLKNPEWMCSPCRDICNVIYILSLQEWMCPPCRDICNVIYILSLQEWMCSPCRDICNVIYILSLQEWMCPPCRDICNCSFCRRKKGKSSTGILIHLARENGYCNVNDYLQSLKQKVTS
ncbi:Cell division cycle-associated 7-like protein [Mactra antiquata]